MSPISMQDKGFASRLLRLAGSLRLSVVVMLTIGAVCAFATFYEMSHGTPAVQREIYATRWFAFLLGLLGLNVLASMAVRWPWSKHHAGFLAAHLGILLVLVGSVVSLYRGLDSSMALYEGETSDRVSLLEPSLQVHVPGQRASGVFGVAFEARPPRPGREARFAVPGSDVVLLALDYAPHVEVTEQATPDGPRRTLAPRTPPAKEARRQPAVLLQVERRGARSEPAWVLWGESTKVGFGDQQASVAFRPPEALLPFSVTLLRFNNESYPGSRMAATYESTVRVDDPERGSFETLVSMNHPLHHRGYIFFQSSFVEGRPMISIFSVARAPGLPLVYLGTTLIGAGILWMFYVKPWLARRQGARALAAGTLLALSLSGPLASRAAAAEELAPLRELAIQDAGRVKPLDTFARELARRVQGAKPFGLERVAGLEPSVWLLASHAAPERWQAEEVVRVTHAGLRRAAGLPAARDRFSLQQLAQHAGLRSAVGAVRAKLDHDQELDPIERELLELENTLVTYQGVLTGEALRLVPHPDDPKAAWFSIADLRSPEAAALPQLGRVRALSGAMLEAYRAGDLAGVATAARAFSARLAELAPAVYPDAKALRIEVHYNTLRPFGAAWVLYLAGFLALLASLPLASRRLKLAGYAALVVGFLLNSYGMLLRVLISGRPPVTNMYETIVFVAWGGVLLALVFEACYKTHVFAACAGALSTLALIIAERVPIFDAAIAPLVPVLRDNTWLTVHVLTIMLGYAALTLAMGIAHLNLGLYFFRPGDVVLFKRLSLFLYRALQLGTLLLALGTLLGGVWASYSWGRFWGWDPKETWALIALLGYLAVLHGRFAGWIRDFGMAVGAIVGYLLVLMAWYGVNYLLGTGLHSYGFGSGGYWYVGSFVAFEVLVIAAAVLRRRSVTARRSLAAPVAVQPAH